MSIMKVVSNKRPEETFGEKKLSDKEVYLLRALLNMLLYSGIAKEGGKGLLFTSAESMPTALPHNIQVGG